MDQKEIGSASNSKKKHAMGYLGRLISLILLPSSVIIGNLVATKYSGSLHFIPLLGIFLGIVGGVIAGVLPLFVWKLSEKIKIIILIVLLSFTIYSFIILEKLVILVFLPGLINSLIVFGITRTECALLQKSPVKWWLFVVILIIGLVIIIFSTGVLSFLGAGLMSQ